MKNSSLCSASLSATDFRVSQLPSQNKALADENADLRAKVAQLLDEKQKWQIKYCNLNMKVSDYTKYRKDVKHLLQRMSFYLQNFLVVRDMLDRMSQQESDYEESECHNTKVKQKAEREQVSKDRNCHLMKEEEQQKQKQQQQKQQQHIGQSQSQNTIVNPVLQLSSARNQTQKCVSVIDVNHHLHHRKDNTELQSKDIQHGRLIDFVHSSQQEKTRTVLQEKQLKNVEKEEMLVNEAMQKLRLSNKMEVHQGICLNLNSENNSLDHCSSFQKKFNRKELHEQLLKQNGRNFSLHQLWECCSLECEGQTLESQHEHGHSPQIPNASCDKLKLNLQRGQSENCYPSKCGFLFKSNHQHRENEPQQSSIKGQQDSLSDQFCQKNDCKAHKQRTICIKEMDQQILEQQKPEDKDHPSLESDGETRYYEGVQQQQQYIDIQGNLTTEHEHFNTVIQSQKSFVTQRPSFTDVQAQIMTDKEQQLPVDQGLQVASNQQVKLTVGKGELLRNKPENKLVPEHIRDAEWQTHTSEPGKHLMVTNALQSVDEEEEEEKRKSVKSGVYLPSANDRLHSMKRDQGLNTGNQEISVEIRQQKPVKLCHLLPATLLASLSFRKVQYTTTDQQHHFVTDQQQHSLSNKLQQGMENKNQQLTNRQINQVASDNEMKLKTKERKQFNKEEGLVHNIEQTRHFHKEHEQQVTINKMPELVPRNEQQLSYGQPRVEQGQQLITEQGQQQPTEKQDQQLEEELARQSVVEEVEGLAANSCWPAPEDCQQPAVERAQQGLVERGQQTFTKQTLELSAELSQEILVQKFQDKVKKEVKWLPSEQYKLLVTKKEWKLKGLQGQLTPPRCEKELQEHSSILLLSELSKTGFETSCNSSNQSILHCAKIIQKKNTLNNTVLHRSYMEDSTIKRIPVSIETPIYETLGQHKVSHPMNSDKLFNRNGRPRRKCAVGVNYFISP